MRRCGSKCSALACALAAACFISTAAGGNVINIKDIGAIEDDPSLRVCQHNTAVMNKALAMVGRGDTLLVPNGTFHVAGGVTGADLYDAVLRIDGTLKWNNNQTAWPRQADGRVLECWYLSNLNNVTFTSSGTGTLDGSGEGWWGYISYLLIGENRPRLLHIYNSSDLLVENLLLKQSPYWTFFANDVNGIEVRHSAVEVHRDNATDHDWYNMGAFNTDGFDIAGANVWVHDVTVWNDDDCVCVKQLDASNIRAQCSENWLVERVNVSGVGLTVGSIGPSAHHSCVRNVTFRDSIMPNSFKGLYMKSRPAPAGYTGEITGVTYQNISLWNPTQWAIWIGPQQASYEGACNLLWPFVPGLPCPVPAGITWSDITFKDITVQGAALSPGVILGNETNPMTGIRFDNVVVRNPSTEPWGDKFYACTNTQGVATGGTSPVPPCFKQE